ncbi:tail fiber domain-containing protein [Flavobacteriaceae bacterium]|nr:tail fiber domain-containing protein [Flavobacteriaceae bacterium]
MKKLLLVLLFVPLISFGQNGFNYQAIISNSDGTVVASQSISVRFSVIYDSPNGTVAYSELHSPTTDANGLINLKVGTGTQLSSGAFSSVDWSTAYIYLKREIDIIGSDSYVDLGTDLIGQVPVALYAKNVNLLDANNTIAIGGVVSATNSVAVGKSALSNNTSGGWNTAVGMYSLLNNTTGISNTAIGYGTLFTNTSSGNNTANGYAALYNNTTGDGNTANGTMALYDNTTGDYNSANGSWALYSNTTGANNTANGGWALFSNTTGDKNTANGVNSLYSNTTGNNNTAIGHYANVGSNNLTNATAIGYDATVSASNKIRLGNTNVTSIEGQVAWTNASDRRLKKDITSTKYGLETILKLVPVDYLLKSNNLSQIGFIAQDLKPIVPEAVNGTEGDIEKGETLGITYTTLIPILTKAIQELKKENEDLKKRIDALENK